jgi:hypothetical protein
MSVMASHTEPRVSGAGGAFLLHDGTGDVRFRSRFTFPE